MSTTAKAKAFHHQQSSSSAVTSSANKNLCSNSNSFNQNISSTSLLLIDTSSPPLSVSDNGSVSSGNESSTTPLHHQNPHPRQQQQTNSGPSSMIWVNGNSNPDSSSVNGSENQNNRGFTRPSGQGSTGYLRSTSEGNGNNSVYTENQSPATSQRSSNPINIVTTSQNDYLRYSGTNSSGGILWPLPPITTNQQQIVSSPHCDTQSPSLTSNHQSSSQSSLIKNSQNLSQNNGDHHGNQINVNSKSNKKESHNRIERKRRDYINTQIASLGTLLPQELYRGVDGKRNKGSVLKLSVNYIQELRSQLSRMNTIQEENQLARQLIPVILQRVKFLEKTMTNLLNECFTNGNTEQGNLLSSDSKSQITISEQIEKKYLKFQKLLYEAISNRFDSVNGSGESSSNGNSTLPLKWDPETFEGIERENQSILENDVVQAWLRVFENNKSSELYPGQSMDNNKSDYHPNGSNDRDDTFFQNCLQDIQISNKRMTENSILTGTKHRFMNDNSVITPTVAKNCRRSTRHTNNNMSNCSSEASNTDESSPLSNMAASCPVEHRLFYASNQGNSSNNDTTNNNCLDGNQSLLLTYPGGGHDQNGNTTDFSLGQIQTSDILLTNSHGNNCSMNSTNSGSNHCIVMRNDKVNDDMLCQSDSSVIDNPIILSTFFGPNAYEQNISSNQALLTSEQLHQLNNNHYQMLLHQHQTPSDHQQQENANNSRNGQSNSSDNHYHHINVQQQHQHHQLSSHLQQSTRSNQPT